MALRDDERFTPADQLPDGLYDRAKALADAALDVEGYTVPWVAGRSLDGAEFYPDTDLPLEVTDAKIKTRRSVKIHEMAEKLCQDDGETYDKDSDPPGQAHYHANGCEKLDVEAQGGSWLPYCLAFRPIIKDVDDEALTNMPPIERWDRRPYQDDDPVLLAEIDTTDKHASPDLIRGSTFAAPASATSGLAAYDLEGARTRRKRRKRKAATKTGASKPITKESDMDALKLFIPITKIDAAKRLVYGIATAEEPDVTKEICDYASTKPYYEQWSANFEKVTDGKSLGNLRAMHGNIAAGVLKEIAFNDEAKKIEICAKVVDDAEWNKCLEGVYTGFSQGGKYVKRWKDGDLTRYTAEPIEMSLVDSPCLPSATFEIVKADGSTELHKFKEQQPEQAFDSDALIKFAAEWTEGTAVPAAFVRGLFKLQPILKAGDPLYAILKDAKESDKVEPLIGKIAVLAGDGDVQRVYVHKRLPGRTFKRKAEMEQALIDLDAADAAMKMAAPVLADLKSILAKHDGAGDQITTAHIDVVKKFMAANAGHELTARARAVFEKGDPNQTVELRKELREIIAAMGAKVEPGAKVDPDKTAGDLGKKDYTADERKQGAKEGWAKKDGSYPIKTAADVANAVKDWIRSKGSATDKRHIIKRAKALKATDKLPADWSGSTQKDDDAEKLAGDMELKKGVWLWDLSNMLQLLAQIAQLEQLIEDKDWGPFVDIPPELQTRLAGMAGEFGDIIAEMLDLVLAEIKPEEATAAVANAALTTDLVKLLAGLPAEAFAKAGAKHAKADKDRIKQAHDLLTELDPDCCPGGDGEDDDAEKMVKSLQAKLEATEKANAAQLTEIMTLVKQIAAQPLPMGTSSVTLTVVDKTGDDNFAAFADKLGTVAAGADGLTRFADAAQLAAARAC